MWSSVAYSSKTLLCGEVGKGENTEEIIAKISLISLIQGIQNTKRIPVSLLNYIGLFFELFWKTQELSAVKIMVCIQRVGCILIPVTNHRVTCIYTMQQLQGWVILHHISSVLSSMTTKHPWGEKALNYHFFTLTPATPVGLALALKRYHHIDLNLLISGRQELVVFWDGKSKKTTCVKGFFREFLAAHELQMEETEGICLWAGECQPKSKGLTLGDKMRCSSVTYQRLMEETGQKEPLKQALGIS